MDLIINLLVSAGVLFLLAYIMPQVHVKSFGTALWVAILIGLLNATIGLILSFIFNLFTLFLLSFIVRLVVMALIVKLVDKLVRNFKVDGFWPALVIAVALAIAGTLIDRSNAKDGDLTMLENRPVQEAQLFAAR
ncbi:phage holin family protein [Botryobacter ruber]|uniref:phage holin family protein n=1 Tax=Botryobacter ruber TaxID=2171629 RepID=UPI000E0C075F|nr:phage holin family protein [Botryobacter ruber]